MITKVIDAVVAALKTQSAFSGKNVIPSYDQSFELDGGNGVIVAVSGSSEVMVNNAAGRPIAWTCNITVMSATHRVADKNGAIRKALSEAAHDFFITLSSLTITGYTLAGVIDVHENETSTIGDNYIVMSCLASLIISKTT